MREDTWIKNFKRLRLNEKTAVVGSPGLRSIGRLVIDSLINKIKPELIAELYSTHFPVIYQTKPSYASHPRFPGIGGVKIDSGEADFPKVQFYSNEFPPLVITRGCHANFDGQYEVIEKVLDFYDEVRVRKMIVVAGYGLDGMEICCAATNLKIIDDLKENYGIEVSYNGPFYGFSGLIFGLAKLRGIEAICLFARTEPRPKDPEYPDEEASKKLLIQLVRILNVTIDG